MIASELGRRVFLARRDLDMNQDVLADATGVSRPYISRLERGHIPDIPVSVIEALAAALDIRPEYLAGWSEDATGEDRPANVAEGRVVYQVARPGEYRLIQDLLAIWPELAPEDQRLLIDMARRLRASQDARVIE